MKNILKFTLLFTFALQTTDLLIKNIYYQENIWILIKVAFVLAIFELLLKPIIKVLLLPINILTLGTFRTVINTFGLYLAIFLIMNFKINNFHLFDYYITGFWSIFFTSLIINLILNLFNSILSKKKK
jgi:putative membrane protein